MNEEKLNTHTDDFTKAMTDVMSCYGTVAGALKYYMREMPKALNQLKELGCPYCTHKRCEGCEDGSNWAWDDDA